MYSVLCVVEWFLWTIEHTNRSLDIQCNVSTITGFVRRTNYKFVMGETLHWISSDLLVCSIVRRNHSTIDSACLITSITVLCALVGVQWTMRWLWVPTSGQFRVPCCPCCSGLVSLLPWSLIGSVTLCQTPTTLADSISHCHSCICVDTLLSVTLLYLYWYVIRCHTLVLNHSDAVANCHTWV